MSENRVGSMGSFLVGAAVGAGLALILAPMAGGETRRRIGGAARKLRDGAADAMGNVKSLVKDGANEVNAAVNSGRDAIHHGTEKATVPGDR